MVEKSRISNEDEPRHPVDNSQYVHDAVESSAQSAKNFLALAQPIREKVITSMTYILCVVEKRNRGRWCANRIEIGIWKLNTLATFRGNAKYDEEEGVKETEEAILLRQLAEGISEEFRIYLPDLFAPIGAVFERSMTILESGFQSYDQVRKHLDKSRESGETQPGTVRRSAGVSDTGNATFLRPQFHKTGRRIY